MWAWVQASPCPIIRHKSRIVGIDLSEQMLRKSRQRVVEGHLRNVENLAFMDAERLDFPDASFDVVVAQYVVIRCPIRKWLWTSLPVC
jgi:phosphatidylethanolamine/phosphatidyl-N-methylethanolamine N-methyltransferase